MPDYIFIVVLLILVFAPGYDDRPSPERPKKGFWRAADVLYPVRKSLRGLWPENPKLLTAYRGSLALAAILIATVNLATISSASFAKAKSPFWLAVECGVLAFLIGRAFGFWSADRRLGKSTSGEEQGSVKD